MNAQETPPARLVINHMLAQDRFSQWLGIELLDCDDGYSKIKMTVRQEMVNGFGIAHGGIAFALADSAFAFACNSRNDLSVALEANIHFLKPVHVGDQLTAEARRIHHGKTTGVYLISVFNQQNEQVALFKATCYSLGKPVM
ncbi:MAG: hydroxyphenylacetyl-CoA thioesterase PaaI [Chitinophagaceae bacterium]|nr:hydroxyphenylacetyl-CoA thioesterase PaaI [Chitinophagaceae bacterium]